MSVQLALTGVIPAVAAMWYVDRLDSKRPEPPLLRRMVVLFGALSVIPTLGLGWLLEATVGVNLGPGHTYNGALYRAFLSAGAIEELCKIAVVYWVVWRRPEFDERMDGIVYATRAGLGFAMVENFFYLLNEQGMGFVTTWLLRAFLAVPGHAMWTGMIGALAARRRFDGRGVGLVGGYLLAVLFHGTYDACIFLGAPLTLEGHRGVATALLAGPLVLTVAAALLMRRLSRAAAHLDDADALAREGHLGTAAVGGHPLASPYAAPAAPFGLPPQFQVAPPPQLPAPFQQQHPPPQSALYPPPQQPAPYQPAPYPPPQQPAPYQPAPYPPPQQPAPYQRPAPLEQPSPYQRPAPREQPPSPYQRPASHEQPPSPYQRPAPHEQPPSPYQPQPLQPAPSPYPQPQPAPYQPQPQQPAPSPYPQPQSAPYQLQPQQPAPSPYPQPQPAPYQPQPQQPAPSPYPQPQPAPSPYQRPAPQPSPYQRPAPQPSLEPGARTPELTRDAGATDDAEPPASPAFQTLRGPGPWSSDK
ncbi:MAG: PrsW family intramembrane metalloprotease [Kofleriaceae bacterium]